MHYRHRKFTKLCFVFIANGWRRPWEKMSPTPVTSSWLALRVTCWWIYLISYGYFADFHKHNCLLVLTNCLVLKPSEERQRTEKDAIRIATEMRAELWAVSAKTGKRKNRSAHTSVLYGTLRQHEYKETVHCSYFQGRTCRGFSSGWRLWPLRNAYWRRRRMGSLLPSDVEILSVSNDS